MPPRNAATAEFYERNAIYKGEIGATIPFRYYNVIRNCGDAITSYILENSFGVTGRVTDSKDDHLLAIGSIFFMANQKSHIWGSGVLSPNSKLPAVDVKKIHAVRGKKTIEHLRSIGYTVPDMPLGDPGIFVSDLVSVPEASKYRAAIVPHHSGFHSPKWNFARDTNDFCLVDMMDDTIEPLRQIADSEVVISQSLHGLIFAAALGKPYLWISGSSSEVWNWKFLDWFSTCENAQTEPVLLNVPVDEMLRMAEVRPCTASKRDLKAAFPAAIVDETPRVRGDFHVNRLLAPAQVFVDAGPGGLLGRENYSPKGLADHLTQVRSNAFRGVPEPTYLAVSSLSASFRPSRAELLDGVRFLDENRDAALLWYPGYAELTEKPTFVMSSGILGEAYLADGTVLLRPDGAVGLSKKYAHVKV